MQNIRPAKLDDVSFVVPLLLQAMGGLGSAFTNNASPAEQVKLFEHFFLLPGNQYSFENTLVLEIDGKLSAMSNGYDGARLQELRSPFFQYISTHYKVLPLETDNETEAGEFYIDCISVAPGMRGKGLGTQLLVAMIERGRQLAHPKAGLLVNIDNIKAKNLYTKMGFEVVKLKTFMGLEHFHMQYSYTV